MKKYQPLAFPLTNEMLGEGQHYMLCQGMEMRDYFAAQCMAGDWVTGEEGWASSIPDANLETRARLYYRMSDIMMKVRGE